MDISKEIRELYNICKSNYDRMVLDILTELNGKTEELFTGCNEHFNDRDSHLHKPTIPKELKPCPYCAGVRIDVVEGTLSGGMYFCVCDYCGARSGLRVSRKSAREAWDHRS